MKDRNDTRYRQLDPPQIQEYRSCCLHSLTFGDAPTMMRRPRSDPTHPSPAETGRFDTWIAAGFCGHGDAIALRGLWTFGAYPRTGLSSGCQVGSLLCTATGGDSILRTAKGLAVFPLDPVGSTHVSRSPGQLPHGGLPPVRTEVLGSIKAKPPSTKVDPSRKR